MSGADEEIVDRGSGLEREQLNDEGVEEKTTKLRQGLGQDKVLLRTIELHCVEDTRIHDCDVGTQRLADGYIGSADFVFEQLQGEQDACRDRVAPPRDAFGEATGATLLHGFDQLGPGKCISPLADERVLGTTSATWSRGPLPRSQCSIL